LANGDLNWIANFIRGIEDDVQEIANLNILMGVPLVEEVDDRLKSVRHYYLGDSIRIDQAIRGAAGNGEAFRIVWFMSSQGVSSAQQLGSNR
jgi:hypothetical protein